MAHLLTAPDSDFFPEPRAQTVTKPVHGRERRFSRVAPIQISRRIARSVHFPGSGCPLKAFRGGLLEKFLNPGCGKLGRTSFLCYLRVPDHRSASERAFQDANNLD